MKPPEEEVKAGAPEWVVTFGDMMSLLLTFFVLLLSFSTMEAQKFKVIAGFMREAFGVRSEQTYSGVPMGTTILSTETRETAEPKDELDLVQKIRVEMEKAKITRKGSVEVTERGVAVRLDGELLFDSGRAELKSEGTGILDGIAGLAALRSEQFEVEGHTDDVPIKTSRYPSNWELATARAGAAARYLIDKGIPPTRIRAVGYADTRPIVANDSPENRAQNRRVEFLFVREAPTTKSEPSRADPDSAESLLPSVGLTAEPAVGQE